MTEIHCTLVGFRHHAWRGTTLDNRIAQAQGRQVVLMRNRENHRNSDAAVAYIDNEVVAYVSNDDCRRIDSYIDATEYGLLYGRITSVDTHEYRCTALIEVTRTIGVSPYKTDTLFEQWNSTYNSMPIARHTDEELQLHMLQCHLLTQLDSRHTSIDQLCCDIERYIATTRYDISAEASQTRRIIAEKLQHCTEERLRHYAISMEAAITAMGNNEVCADIARRITHNYAQSSAIADMIRHNATIERTELEQALSAMPYKLHNEYRLSLPDFVSRAYYLHIPQQVLRRFICIELLLNHTIHAGTADCTNQDSIRAASEYISRINRHISPNWHNKANALWDEILEQFANRITRLNGVKDTLFNARFICQTIGRLIDLGVYDSTVTQAEYGRIMAMNGRNMRSSINRGLTDDPDTRKAIGIIVERHK